MADLRRTRITLLLAILLGVALAAPLAAAGVDLDPGPARVELVDHRGADCALGLKVCLVEVSGDDLGSTEVDARLTFQRATVSTDFSDAREHAGELWLLPDRSVTFQGSSLYVMHPAPDAYLTLGRLSPLGPEHPVQYEGREKGFALHCNTGHLVPRDQAPSVLCLKKTYTLNPIAGSSGGNFIGGDGKRIWFYNADVPLLPTDYYIDITLDDPCEHAGVCWLGHNETGAALKEALPNAHVAFRLESAQLATDPALLVDAGLDGVRRAVSTSVHRHAPASPASPALAPDDAAPPHLDAGPRVPPRREGAPADDAPAPRADGRISTAALVHDHALPPLWTLVATGAFAGLLLVAAAVALYSRFHDRAQAMRSETRRRVLAALRAEPGLTPTELAERVGLTRNAVSHHVDILVDRGYAYVERRRRRVFVFPRGTEHVMEDMVLARLCAEDPLVDLLARHPGLARAEIHRLLPNVPQRTRNHKLRRLLEMGAIRRERHDGADRYFVAGE